MPLTLHAVQQYIDSLILPPSEESAPEGEIDPARFKLDAARDQAFVVASDVVSFVKGVTEARRQDVVQSTLLAQLVARHKVPNADQVDDWYRAYFDVLANVGWSIQDNGFATFSESMDNVQVSQAIIELAQTVLAGSPAAIELVQSTLKALSAASNDQPWITLFKQDKQSAQVARFQIAMVDDRPDGQFMLHLIGFTLEAKVVNTQVLLFKFQHGNATFRDRTAAASSTDEVLAISRDMVKQKLAERIQQSVNALDLG